MSLNEKEKKALREKAKAEYKRLLSIQNDLATLKMINGFNNKFLICEVIYKVILEEYQCSRTGKRSSVFKIHMNQVIPALSFAGYNFDKALLTPVFGTEKGVGKRTVKSLRDALTHEVSKSAVDELYDRNKELHGYMDRFLEIIQTFDATG